jgi:hypothetical protein
LLDFLLVLRVWKALRVSPISLNLAIRIHEILHSHPSSTFVAPTGKVGKLVYHLFLDAACTRFVNRVTHNLEKAVPNYGLCVVSEKYQDVKLTVCHNAGAAVVVKD